MDEVFKRIYRFSNFTGMFPLQIKDGKFILSVLYTALWITSCGLMWTLFFYSDANVLPTHVRQGIPSFLMNLSSLLLDLACVCLSPIWFYLNIKKFNKILDLFLEVKEITGHSVGVRDYYTIFLVLLVLARDLHLRTTLLGWSVKTFLLIIFPWCTISRFLILNQFATLLFLAKNYLWFLSSRTTRQNAARSVDACERLHSACRLITQCYTPPILFAIMAAFVFLTTRGFILVRRLEYEDRLSYGLIVSILTSFIDLIYIGRMATNTIVQAKEYERVLYTLVINDETTSLVTNNKIELHILSEATLEFPLYGLFNLDYTLLCIMVSSSVGYIVMLLDLIH